VSKKEELLEEIAETLADISDSLEGINMQLGDLSMCSKMQIFFKMIELRPEMKEKLDPLINEMVESFDFTLADEEPGDE
jgi:hypothetical protein